MTPHPSRFLLACVLSTVACGGAHRAACVAEPAPRADSSPLAPAPELGALLSSLKFSEKKAAQNLSDACANERGELVVVSDEGTALGIVAPPAQGRVVDLLPLLNDPALGASSPDEIDLEGAATWQSKIALCGSASLKRKKPKSADNEENVRRMGEVIPASGEGNAHSNYVYVLDAPASEALTLADHWDLRAVLLADPLLQPFRELPSKDNGIDVEGIAADAAHLYFGLRGPVLRGHALVLTTDWQGHGPELSVLNLNGLGIRGLVREPQGRGFYVLAGPTMELDGPFVVYAWNGRDSVFADDASRALAAMFDVPSDRSSHPEALFLWQGALCVASDGPKHGAPACLKSVTWPL